MLSYGREVRDDLRMPTRNLRHAIPQVYAFKDFYAERAVQPDGHQVNE